MPWMPVGRISGSSAVSAQLSLIRRGATKSLLAGSITNSASSTQRLGWQAGHGVAAEQDSRVELPRAHHLRQVPAHAFHPVEHDAGVLLADAAHEGRAHLLESTSADLDEQLLQGRIDLAVLFADNLTSGMRHDALLEEDLFVVSACKMPDEVALSALHDLPLVMPARLNSVRLLLDKACSLRGVMPRILAEISSPYTMLPWSMLAHADLRGLWAARILAPRLIRTLCVAEDAQVVESSRLQAIREVVSELLRSLGTRSARRGARIKRRAVRTSG